MKKFLNDNINIDLHIHSIASKYKEADNYVDSSNIDNIEVLFKKLNYNDINMFAISDHNNFDYKLYSRCIEIIASRKYENVLKVLPAIEFDVKLEQDKEVCHIITIFRDNDLEAIKKIEACISTKMLKGKNDYYSKDDFENILKSINLDVILIAHQHTDFNYKSTKKSRSLTESTSNALNMLKVGYINALEYQQSNIQGMIINSLSKENIKIATLIGSDCHQWECYPLKDKKSKPKDYVTKIKALPSFNGLLFSITSIETRFNRNDFPLKYIKEITINGNKIPLSKSVNAIIGDNGSGKSMILDMLYDNNLPAYYKSIIDTNGISYVSDDARKEYIKQNSIIEDVKNGTLFNKAENNFFKEVTTKERYIKEIDCYFKKLIKCIKENIETENKRIKAYDAKLPLQINTDENYIPHIDCNISVEINIIEERYNTIENIYSELKSEYDSNKTFYNKNYSNIKKVLQELKRLKDKMKTDNNEMNKQIELQNATISSINDFNSTMSKNKTDKQKYNENYKNSKKEFINNIVNYLKSSIKDNKFPIFPKAINGHSINKVGGYSFVRKTKYSGKIMQDDYFLNLFNGKTNIEALSKIKKEESLVKILSGISNLEDISHWYNKIEKISNEKCKEETFIEKTGSKEEFGKTPGEVSIVYYDYVLKASNNNYDVLLIDQPEDDISNNKISNQLVSYINEVRDKKQIILVTHNPILVVNLDVDNVIYINKDSKNNISIKNGCLEYEEENYSIIKEVATTMDGGKETVERRLKLYGSKY